MPDLTRAKQTELDRRRVAARAKACTALRLFSLPSFREIPVNVERAAPCPVSMAQGVW
ncbi:MAG: hypothetical protein ACJ8DU_15375 [Microvirga sp.]|jgi:hypothetical protein